ncbi:hypothetical protein BHE74_00007636 [Ensete ventricosum]|nr:hypothetical protein BHE74_00007636 [Ensete ventricosum]
MTRPVSPWTSSSRFRIMKVDIKFPSTLCLMKLVMLSAMTFWQNMGLTNSTSSKLFCAGNGLVVEQQGDAVSFIQVLKAAQLLEDAEVKCQ